MKFNDYELEYTPDACTEPRAQKVVSVVDTYSSVQFFDWGMMLPGVKINIGWDLMSVEEFNILDAFYSKGGTVLWASDIQGKKYEVIIASFTGALINGTDSGYREKVTMMLYMSNHGNSKAKSRANPTKQ